MKGAGKPVIVSLLLLALAGGCTPASPAGALGDLLAVSLAEADRIKITDDFQYEAGPMVVHYDLAREGNGFAGTVSVPVCMCGRCPHEKPVFLPAEEVDRFLSMLASTHIRKVPEPGFDLDNIRRLGIMIELDSTRVDVWYAGSYGQWVIRFGDDQYVTTAGAPGPELAELLRQLD